MNTTFPLYNTLKQKCENLEAKIYTYEEQIELCNLINKNLDHQGYELLYIIIKYFSIYEDKLGSDMIPPYKPKLNKSGIKYDMSCIPNKLIQIIDQFIQLHLEKINEEKVRENNIF